MRRCVHSHTLMLQITTRPLLKYTCFHTINEIQISDIHMLEFFMYKAVPWVVWSVALGV